MKRKMTSLLKKGKSLDEISKITGLGKTTIYYHYRKYYKKKTKPVRISRNDSELLGEFLGVIAGDGYINVDKTYHHRVRIFLNISEEEYASKLTEMITNFLGKPPHRYVHLKGNCIQLSILSREVCNLIREYLDWESKGHRSKSRSVKLKKIESDDKFKIGFLRGCVDTDGYINKNRIQFSTASKGLCDNTENFLRSLGISFSTYTYQDRRPNRSVMYLTSIRSISRERFLQLISPRNIANAPVGI